MPAERAPAVSEQVEAAEPSLRTLLEAILLVVDEPVAASTRAQVVERPTPDVSAELQQLSVENDADQRGFQLRSLAGGWRLYTRPDAAAYVERFVRDGQSTRLSQAALETLAVIAYRQPITRGRIAAIRGVNVDAVVRTLLARGLITEDGIEPSGASRYVTTPLFLERLGLSDLGDLPPVAPGVPDPGDLDPDEFAS
jgi:segregation and condensation protein B